MKRPQVLDGAALTACPRQRLHAKPTGPDGVHRTTVEADGAALKDLLEKAEVAKSIDDGFNPPLDVFVVVTASDGTRSLCSGGEIFLSRDPVNVLLVDTEGGSRSGGGRGASSRTPGPTSSSTAR